jgi:hypothetical protein
VSTTLRIPDWHRGALTGLFTTVLAACGGGGSGSSSPNQESASPPVIPTVTTRDCVANPELFKTGTFFQNDTQSFAQGQRVELQNRYQVLGAVSFKGISAVETQLDTTTLGSGDPTVARTSSYGNLVADAIELNGAKSNITTPMVSFNQTQSYTPAVRFPLTAVPGQAVTQTVTVKTESDLPGSPALLDYSQTYVWKFVGLETVSVPAGTFETCRIETTITSNQGTATLTQWTIANGPLRSLLAKTNLSTTGTVNEAIALRIN